MTEHVSIDFTPRPDRATATFMCKVHNLEMIRSRKWPLYYCPKEGCQQEMTDSNIVVAIAWLRKRLGS
jgi:hypothetical protein